MWGIYNYTCETNHVSRVECCSYSVFTICATYNVISDVTYVFTFTLVLSGVCMCVMSSTAVYLFLYFFDFILSFYVAKVFPK